MTIAVCDNDEGMNRWIDLLIFHPSRDIINILVQKMKLKPFSPLTLKIKFLLQCSGHNWKALTGAGREGGSKREMQFF